MALPFEEQFPHGSIIQLESDEQEAAGYILSQDIELATETGDPELIAEIRALWDGEEWDDIVSKARVEGSTWYVWWMDGVRAFLLREKSRELHGLSKSETTSTQGPWSACTRTRTRPPSSSRKSYACQTGTTDQTRPPSCTNSG